MSGYRGNRGPFPKEVEFKLRPQQQIWAYITKEMEMQRMLHVSILTGGPKEEKNSMNQWPEQGQSNLGKKEKQQKILCPAKPS